MKLKEHIRKVLKEETKELYPQTYVVFVSGIQSLMSHEGQTSLFKSAFGPKYPVKSFNFKSTDLINKFLLNNNIKAVVLFSAACKLANQLNLPSGKIYCIEPWNGKDEDAGTDYIYENIPAQNMYIDVKSYSRGKGTKKGANETDHSGGHFKSLTSSAMDIYSKL